MDETQESLVLPMGSFKIDTDGKPIGFMIPSGDYLYIGAKNDEGTIKSIHRVKQDKNIQNCKITGGEIWLRRSKSPLFERVALQFIDVIKSNFLELNENNADSLTGILIEIALDISKAEEKFLEYVDVENKSVSNIQNMVGIKPQKNAFVYQDPTVQLQEISEIFLIRIVIAYRKLPEIISLIRGHEYKTGKNFLKKIAEMLPQNHPDRKALEYDNEWLKELYDIRGDIEHERWSIIPFEVKQNQKEEGYEIHLCSIPVKSQDGKVACLSEYLNVTLHNMLTFIEEIISLAMFDKIKHPAKLITLPENERPKRNHYRYVLDLFPEIISKLPES